MLAGLGHDLNHSKTHKSLFNPKEGLGNAYYIQAKHEYALKYCNVGVLENMHSAYLLSLMRKKENDIFIDQNNQLVGSFFDFSRSDESSNE